MRFRERVKAAAGVWFVGALVVSAVGAKPASGADAKLGDETKRIGDEIVVCGRFFHTTTQIITWMDPGGYDAYRVERRFGPLDKSSWGEIIKENPKFGSPNRYGLRSGDLSEKQVEAVRGGGWDLPTLQKVVDQFVIHFDVCGASQTCFRVLQDERDLSVQFMLDVDGTIYQTLDLKERAQHATISNSRSVGIEIANMGAYPPKSHAQLDKWYAEGPGGAVLKPPKPWKELGLRTAGFEGKPDRPELIQGNIQGDDLVQYDFTPQQYASLIKLTATLCTVFPKIKCDYPKDAKGELIPKKLDDPKLAKYHGVLGHYHIQTNKNDPGPAFNWEKVIGGAKKLMK